MADIQLIKYDAMCHAIAEAYAVDEVKAIRDKAVAMEAYFRVAQDPEPERRACEIRLRAERRAGALLKGMETAQGKRTDLTLSDGSTKLEQLQASGITRDQASKWQQLADVPEPDFEAALASPTKPSTNGILRQNKAERTQAVDLHLLWLWGRMQDFEREGILERSAADLCAEIPPHMVPTLLRLIPGVCAWLLEVERTLHERHESVASFDLSTGG